MTPISKTYTSTITVRGYELDAFGHVNHAVYVSYLEHARWNLLSDEQITFDKFKEWGAWPVIAGIELQYLKPCYMGDVLEIQTRVIELSRTSFIFEQEIKRDHTPVLRAKIRAVMVNERGRPTEVPSHIRDAWRYATS